MILFYSAVYIYMSFDIDTECECDDLSSCHEKRPQ